MMNILTERLCIRHFLMADWQDLYTYTSDAKVMKYIPEAIFTEDSAKQLIAKSQGEQAIFFAVALQDSDKVIGHISFEKSFGNHTYEIGWVFNPLYYNKGYATEAAQAIITYGFTTLKLHRIVATCQPENIGSYRVMEKIGMRKEGFFKKCIPYGDEWWDEYYYAILAEEFYA